MAVIQEDAGTRQDGVQLVRFRSDAGKMIMQVETGNIYAEAVDIATAGFTYTETETDIPDIDNTGNNVEQ